MRSRGRIPQLEHECVHEDITSTWNENRHSLSRPTLRVCMCGPAHSAVAIMRDCNILECRCRCLRRCRVQVRLLLKAAPEAALEVTHRNATPLIVACVRGHTAIVRELLAAAPQAASIRAGADVLYSPLHAAVVGEHLEATRAILQAAPQTALLSNSGGRLPLHDAAALADRRESAEWVQMLLTAAPETATATFLENYTALHIAAVQGNAAAVQLLVQAAPEALHMSAGQEELTPFEAALSVAAAAAQQAEQPDADNELQFKHPSAYLDAARPMLAALPPDISLPSLSVLDAPFIPLFPDVAAHWQLTAAQWALIPAPCPGLGRALPAALQRSEAEAALLVARLPPADSDRLRAFALALHRAQRQLGVFLPAELAGRILSLFGA